VAYVIDGDTVQLQDGRHIRIIGINTPEKKQKEVPAEPLANQATLSLRKIISQYDGQLRLRLGKEHQDHYGRTLAHLFLPNGNNLTALLLRQGNGMSVSIPPNLQFQACYLAAENSARQLKRGVWGNEYFNIRSVSALSKKDTGFHRVQGTVSRVGESSKAFWFNLGKGFAIRLPKSKLPYFSSSPNEFPGQFPNQFPDQHKDKLITLRGWVYYVQKRNELRINLNHPNMIESIQRPIKPNDQ
jgi:endonuclease YncB( thermonuclease family)